MVQRNDRLLYISMGRGCCASYPDFEDWSAQSKSFEGMAIVHGVRKVLSDQNGFSESYDATEVSAGTFGLVGQKPFLGRDFTPSDEIFGAPPVAILSDGFWERRFGRDPEIIGKTIRMNGAPTTVIGVMPHGFSFPQKQDLWVPLVKTPEVLRRENRGQWFAFGRLAEGATMRERPRRNGNHRTPAGHRLSGHKSRSELTSHCSDVSGVLYTPKRDSHLLDDVGRGRLCAVDRLREPGESDACPRDWPVPRDFRPHRARRRTLAGHPATADRERDALGRRGRIGLVAGPMERASLPACRSWPGTILLARPRLRHGLPRSVIPDRDFHRNGVVVWTGSGAADLQARRQHNAERWWPRRTVRAENVCPLFW